MANEGVGNYQSASVNEAMTMNRLENRRSAVLHLNMQEPIEHSFVDYLQWVGGSHCFPPVDIHNSGHG